MRRKLLTTVGLTSAVLGGGAAYAYTNPEQMPKEVQEWVRKAEAYDPRKQQSKQQLKVSDIPKNIKSMGSSQTPHSAIEQRSKTLETETKTLPETPNIKGVDVKKPLDALQKPKTPEEEQKHQKELDARLLKALEEAESKVKAATQAKYSTISAIKKHAETLKKAVDEGQNGDWNAVNQALSQTEKLAKVDISQEAASRTAIDGLRKLISDIKGTPAAKNNSLVLMASETANKFNHQLDELNHLAEKARNERRIFNQYKELIERSREHFAQELNSIVPGVDIHAKEDKLTKDELNALIAHAYLRVDQLRRQLVEQQVREEQNIAKAIEDQRVADTEVANAQLDLEVRRVRESKNIDVEKKVQEERKVWESELEARLQRASLAHAEHLESVVRTQKQLHDIENAKLVEEAVKQERNLHLKEVQQSVAKLNGIEHALQNRVGWDSENRRSKQYWLACQNLVESIEHGRKAANNVEARRKPLENELNVIKEACEKDNFVQSLINLFPKTAVQRGVYTEEDLKNRFERVYKLGKKTAKVDQNGGSLSKYFSSWLQSWFMIELPVAHSPEDNIDLQHADNYDLLARAKYFIEHNDFDSAIRLLNLLEGVPGRLARDWLTDASQYLETRFLAQLLVDHATVTSIRSIY